MSNPKQALPLSASALLATAAVAAVLISGCAARGGLADVEQRTASVQRTANGVAHISAPDFETLAYGMAYAYAQDNVCMTADQLVTVRGGERSRCFGGATPGLLARRMFPNERADRPLHRRPHGRCRAGTCPGRRERRVASFGAGYRSRLQLLRCHTPNPRRARVAR